MPLLDLVVGVVRRYARSFDHVLYPPHCLITGSPITCQSPLPLISQEGLDGCTPAPDSTELLLTAQRHIQADDLAFSSVTALWALFPDAPIHNVIMAVKYGGHRTLALALGSLLGEHLASNYQRTSAVTFVPVHPTRRRERGYDQAELIATGAANAMHVPMLPLLQRTRYTGTQTALSDEQRATNVQGAFTARQGAMVSQASIVLVDDVFTTGATANAAALALLEAGARRVDVATLCATV